jgi:ATPase subunit of ABC transporter with duplicated ATPase domains
MYAIQNLGMHYGAKILFTDVNLNLNKGDRYGLVGANGAGKSTFFKILTGEEFCSDGEVVIQKGCSVGWLRQDLLGFENNKILDVVIAGKPDLWKLMQQKAKLIEKADFTEEDGFKLGKIEEGIADLDGYTAESDAERILIGLGISLEKYRMELKTLSGGYKLRVLLAQSLFQNPDALLLDEPTNHLDIFSIRWLENYLKKDYQGLLIFISHDSDFLNNLATHILDIDYAEISKYTGNYNSFKKQKEARHDQLTHQKESALKRVEKMKIFVERFKAKASKAKQAKSKEKMIDKIEIADIKDTTRIAPAFSFTKSRPSGKQVVEVNGICKSFNDKNVLNNITFKVSRGEKVAIIGQNGIGKSTLLKILMQSVAQDKGEFTWGHNVINAYFSQDHHEYLNKSTGVLNWLNEQVGGNNTPQQIRKALGQMLFSQDEVDKNILNISGGESARLLFANIILQNANTLILDEPTNHMDIETIEALAKALKKYDGTIIFVSHDRHFIDKFATRIITLTPKGVNDFVGNYNEYCKQFE